MNFVLSRMNDKKDYTKALISFGVSGFTLLMAVLNLPSIVFAPQLFTFLFSVSMICLMFGLAFINGPATYTKKITASTTNMINTSVLIISITLSLYFSVI